MINNQDFQAILKQVEILAKNQGEGSLEYFNYHKKRYIFDAYLLDDLTSKTHLNQVDKIKLLDIGPSFQTHIFYRLFPRISIDLLVKEHENLEYKSIANRFIKFDLNESINPEKWFQPESNYDVITMLEVIEHLYTQPQQVLKFLSTLLKPKGFIIIQTPNAVSLPYRLRMLIGKNPFMLINDTRDGHYREYTRAELLKIGISAGFCPHQVILNNIMATGSLSSKIFDSVSIILPQDLRKNITMIFQKP